MKVIVASHPFLEVRLIEATFAKSLGSPSSTSRSSFDPTSSLYPKPSQPIERNEEIRQAVRQMLRFGGYKPTGRGKPSSEYLVKAIEEGRLASINPAVDVGNLVSYQSGLPISIIDRDRLQGSGRIDIAKPETTFVFNPAGQVIDVSGLIGFFDEEGPCANAVKDAQRTKTDAGTQRILAIIWGLKEAIDHTDRSAQWLGQCFSAHGANSSPLLPQTESPGS